MISRIDDKLFDYLISNISGARFEVLGKQLYSAELDGEFVPLGGTHDGGADGIILENQFSGKKAASFLQFSITARDQAKAKIKKTILRLREVGRDPKQVVYATNQELPLQDIWTSEFFDELQVFVQIRDAEKFKLLINSNENANKVFLHFFKSDIISIQHSAESLKGSVNQFVHDPTVFAFLDYELRERFSSDHLKDRILDSLIYWSLRDTDPDENRFLSLDAISDSIGTIFPSAKSLLIPQLNSRLTFLLKKTVGEGERVRYHKLTESYCLPFLMRKQLAERALVEVKLQDDFILSIRSRIIELAKVKLGEINILAGIDLIFYAVHDYFVEQGLILAAYLEKKIESLVITEQIIERQISRVLEKGDIPKGVVSPALIEDCLNVLRAIFYTTSEIERKYLGYLSRTSLLVMTLQKSPQMIEYFNKMGGNFRLFVGSDMLVKAISEQLLPEEVRHVELLLNVCVSIGAKLILTETVIEEIFTHLHAVDLEFNNHYREHEQFLKKDAISECDRILIRAYFYGKFSNNKKTTWDIFLNQFITPNNLRSRRPAGQAELIGFLSAKFGMEYLTKEELVEGTDEEEVRKLTDDLVVERGQKNRELSHNDALMVHAVYRQRRVHKEHAIYDGFGYRTWWLTKETRILNVTGKLVMKQNGVPYIMRPEFILNFVALAPNAANARKAFRDLLPTTVGLQLGQHLNGDVMHQLLSGTEEWANITPERRAVVMGDRVNKLKHDRLKRYVVDV